MIWGTGTASQLFIKTINCNFDYYIDSDITKKDNIINGKTVKYSKDIHNWGNKYIIVASSFYYEIKEELLKLGLEEEKDFTDYKEIMKFLDMLDKFINTTEKKDIYCNYPFINCDVSVNGNVSICCFTNGYPIGNIKKVV